MPPTPAGGGATLESAFIIRLIDHFYLNKVKEITKMPILYFMDKSELVFLPSFLLFSLEYIIIFLSSYLEH